ncbi:MAG TPA: hypothetical protein VIL74_05455 [Pyrinomonadaceae bacterium]
MSRTRQVFIFCLLASVFCLLSACGSVPNLEAPECTAARGVVKEFYSYHFGNEMKFSPENLKQREKFLTPEYYESLQRARGEADVFTTNNTDYPKAFRVGKCEIVDPAKTNVQVLLFWKDDARTEQREITAEVVREGDKWLVNKVLN